MSIKKLKQYANMSNIAHELDEETLACIGQKVLLGYKEDRQSMQEWLSDVKQIEELADLKSAPKSVPLPNSSNIKLPIITQACYQFSSGTYPTIFKDKEVVKSVTIGPDDPLGTKAKQGKLCSDFMNYQLLFQYQDWELEQDRLLFLVALIGFICKKEYYDPIKNRIISKIVDYKKLFVNSKITSLKDATRITEEISLKLNDVVARKNKKIEGKSVFLEDAVDQLYELHKLDELNKDIEFLEQELYLDLDDDKYSEPYIVTVTKEDGKVFRIAPRYHEDDIMEEDGNVICIYPIDVYVDYHFLQNPKGLFQSVGFGILLLHLNQTANSTINALMDAAQLANLKAGYMDARCKVIPKGNSHHDQGELKLVQSLPGVALKDSIVPIQYGEPSSVMFQLLQLVIDHAKDLSSSTEINNGTQSSQNAKTGATLALLEQGKVLHASIRKRIYRSMTNEFQLLFKLNSLYLDDVNYAYYESGSVRVTKADFDPKKVKIIPVADPNLASSTEKLANAAFVQSIMGMPGIDPVKATAFILAQTTIPGIEGIMVDPNKKAPPNPELVKIQAEIEEAGQKLNIEGAKLSNDEKRIEIEAQVAQGQILQYKANAMALMAKAESETQKLSLQDIAQQFDIISAQLDHQLEMTRMTHDREMQQNDHLQEAQSQLAAQDHEKELSQQEAPQVPPTEGDTNV